MNDPYNPEPFELSTISFWDPKGQIHTFLEAFVVSIQGNTIHFMHEGKCKSINGQNWTNIQDVPSPVPEETTPAPQIVVPSMNGKGQPVLKLHKGHN